MFSSSAIPRIISASWRSYSARAAASSAASRAFFSSRLSIREVTSTDGTSASICRCLSVSSATGSMTMEGTSSMTISSLMKSISSSDGSAAASGEAEAS